MYLNQSQLSQKLPKRKKVNKPLFSGNFKNRQLSEDERDLIERAREEYFKELDNKVNPFGGILGNIDFRSIGLTIAALVIFVIILAISLNALVRGNI